jgi:hypothetical protein
VEDDTSIGNSKPVEAAHFKRLVDIAIEDCPAFVADSVVVVRHIRIEPYGEFLG